MIQLISIFMQKLGMENDEGLVKKIVAYGGVECVLNNKLFSQDIASSNKLKTILNNCKTFN
jgi:hypothetical protein